jgi:murein L,D-transpeptidase YafK
MRATALALAMGLFGLGLFLIFPEAWAASNPCLAFAQKHAVRERTVLYFKADHQLCIVSAQGVEWSAPASHGRVAGRKQFEGDVKTPEGRYMLAPARASTRFGKFLLISYPNADDRRFAAAHGRRPGGSVGVHGPMGWYAWVGRWMTLIDHSEGCIVVQREALAELTRRITRPTPIELFP